MKLKAPPGVGNPCVAGVTLAAHVGVYEVEDAVGALLIEAFGFVDVKSEAKAKAAPAQAGAVPAAVAPPRRGPPFPKLTHPAWRRPPGK